jgi:proteasome lid subunit RPN8/RPN11
MADPRPRDPFIRLRRDVLAAMVAHARQTYPRECCGLLLGRDGRVERSWPAANLAESATRFLVDPRDHFAAIRSARAFDLAVVGVYHSHPSPPARPSATDLVEATDPDLLTLIVVPAGTNGEPEVRAVYLERGNFREVALVLEP